jgi:hypothetical protein
MPTEKTSQQPAPKPAAPESDPLTVRGEVQQAGVKSGEKNGKHYNRMGVKLGGEWYSSFDTKIELPPEGDTIEITYKPDGQFKTLLSWCFLADDAKQVREPGEEG